ncbi:MAG: SurA N-terminal domain-containing protein [Pseudomonadota bacterium]
MMEAIRKGASSWIVKLLVIVPLVLAFAVWGIEDMLRGFSPSGVAKVGDREISQEEFQDSYNQQLRAVSQQFRRRLTPQEAQAIRLPSQVLTRMVNATLIEIETGKLNLDVSQEDVVREIQKDRLFQDSNGNFDIAALRGMLRQVGLSEERFVLERQKDTLRDQLTSSMLLSVHVPDTLLDLVNRHENQSRSLRYLVVPQGDPAKIAAPDEKVLKEYYEARKSDFVTPEFREVAVLEITAQDVTKAMVIKEEELKAAYEQQKANFNTPERRTIQRMVFQDKAKAEAARKELEAGKDFVEVAKANGLTEDDINLGTQTQSGMIDTALAEAVFKLEKDKPSGVIEGLVISVARVTDITEGVTRTLDDVRDQVRAQLASQRMSEEIQRIHDLVDEMRLAGKQPPEIAKDLKIAFRKIPAVNRSGADPEGKTLIEGGDAVRVLQSAFDGAVGVESEVLERSDGGYTWVDVLGITEKKQRAFEDVKDDVLAAWRERQAADAVRKRASALVERAKKGENLEEIAKEVGVELNTTDPIKRTATQDGLTRAAIQIAFTLPNDGAAATPASDGKGQLIVQVARVVAAPKLEGEARTQRFEALRQQRRADVLQEYVAKLRSVHEVEINQPAINRMLGLDQS